MSAAPETRPGHAASVGRTVLADLKRGDLDRTLRRDLKDLYLFYLDEGRRERLRKMSPVRRWFSLSTWLMKSLILKLTPARRILLLISLLLVLQGRVLYTEGNFILDFSLAPFGYALMFLILMLELKDKLLARDELEVGRAVQLALLPRDNPTLKGWDIWMFTRPANDVGGDLVDYIPVRDGRLGVALGDVAGKGLGAALLMARLQATLRALVTDVSALDQLGRRMNQIFSRDGIAERFATLIYVEMRPDSGSVRIMNAGHLLPVIVRAGVRESLPPVAPPLGMLPDSSYVEQTAEILPGDVLAVFSDGITEARNRQGEFFGEERVMEILGRIPGRPAGDAGRLLLAEVERFVGDQRPEDDVSLILMRRMPG